LKSGTDFGRNNFDLLRLILASAVFVFHIAALTNLRSYSWIYAFVSPRFAVRSFFVISGLLIYRSYAHTPSLSRYFEKRIRRIYPAYFVVIVLAALGLSVVSTVPFLQYFGLGFWKYLGANLLFLNFLAPSLPGVFALNDVPFVNGALWTLKIEVAFYLFVPVIHYLCNRFGPKKTVVSLFALSCMWKYGFELLDFLYTPRAIYLRGEPRSIYAEMGVQFPAQLIYFCAGVLLFLYFDQLMLHMRSIVAVSACLYLVDHWRGRDNFDVLWITGFVFAFGFWRYWGNFSKRGDFSYGVYIVHWPILQLLIALGVVSWGPAGFVSMSVFCVGLTSVLMWYLVESRFLTRGSHYRAVPTESSRSARVIDLPELVIPAQVARPEGDA
jgi:peptidoglycan/LPS O-acetylase OafA/YrhL